MPLDSLLNGWVHDDGTMCDEYLADLPPAGVTWWCTTHQQHVHRPDADRTAGMLAAIRARWSKVAYVGMKPEVVPEPGHQPEWLPDVWHLLAAVEAALAPHEPGRRIVTGSLCERHESHRFFSITATEAADVADCPDCTATVYASCRACGDHVRLDACPVREAVTSALTGGGTPQ